MYLINKYQLNNEEFTFIEVLQKNIRVTFMDYGATIMSIFVPDINGKMETVVMAYGALDSYINNDMYLNAIIGPTSGRIANAEFSINDKRYILDKNFLGTENLHSGSECFAFKFFKYEIVDTKEYSKVIFTINKKAEKSKYPGNQGIKIIYTVREGELLIEFTGDTDEDTLLNLTNHAYFNLSGDMKHNILDHYLFIDSTKHLELNSTLVPIKIAENAGTRLDFAQLKKIKDNFFEGIYDLKTKGIDEPFLLTSNSVDHLQVLLMDKISKRTLKVYTTYPCIVVYTHNYPNELDLLYGIPNKRHLGVCFETQFEPNGINIENIENRILKKEEKYYQKTLYKFGIEE